jgi:hypothetical protein
MSSVTSNVDFSAGEKLLPASSLLKEMITITLRSSLESRGHFQLAQMYLRRAVLNSRQLANCSVKFRKEAETLIEAPYEVIYEHVHGVQPPPKNSTNTNTKPELKLVK